MQTPDLSTSPGAVWRLIWPQLLMMYLLYVMSVTPVWTAGRLGADVQAALGMATQCTLFLSIVSMAVCSGATAAVSQSLGALRVRRAGRYIATTLLLALSLGLLVGIAGYALAGPILRLLRIPDAILPLAEDIWKVFMLGLPFQYVYAGTGVIFRATRHVLPPLAVSAFVACAHAFACVGSGLGAFGLPDCGHMGIAWTTAGAQALGALLNCLLLARTGLLRRDCLPSPRWLAEALPYLVKVAVPAGLAALVWQSGYLVLFVLVASVPFQSVAALAGLTAGMRIEALLFMPAMAFNMTASVLVGNCLGAGRPAEAKRVALVLLLVAVGIMTAMAAVLWPFRPELAALLATDPATRDVVVDYLFYNLLATPFSIGSTALGGVMVGAGATRYNLMVFGASFWGLRIPMGYLLGHVLWGTAEGVFVAMLVSQVLQASAMFAIFLHGRWTTFAMRAGVRRKPGPPPSGREAPPEDGAPAR